MKKKIVPQGETKSNTFKIFAGFVFATLIIIFFWQTQKEEKIPYYVESVKVFKKVPKINLSLDVKLSKRIDKKEIENLGKIIYKKYDGENYKRVFIDYLLVGMTDGNGAYATTHYNPNLDVVLYGLSEKEIANIKDKGIDNKRYWIDDGFGTLITITKNKKDFYLNRYFRNYEIDRKKLFFLIKNKDTIFEIKNSTGGEFYKINEWKELELYDNEGLVYTMLKE